MGLLLINRDVWPDSKGSERFLTATLTVLSAYCKLSSFLTQSVSILFEAQSSESTNPAIAKSDVMLTDMQQLDAAPDRMLQTLVRKDVWLCELVQGLPFNLLF